MSSTVMPMLKKSQQQISMEMRVIFCYCGKQYYVVLAYVQGTLPISTMATALAQHLGSKLRDIQGCWILENIAIWPTMCNKLATMWNFLSDKWLNATNLQTTASVQKTQLYQILQVYKRQLTPKIRSIYADTRKTLENAEVVHFYSNLLSQHFLHELIPPFMLASRDCEETTYVFLDFRCPFSSESIDR